MVLPLTESSTPTTEKESAASSKVLGQSRLCVPSLQVSEIIQLKHTECLAATARR